MIDGLVTTIVPVHNRPMLLGEAVASVLSQTYRPIEIVIVDDGSTDDTPAVADAIATSNPDEVRVIHQPNAGPGMAREAGRRVARGEFIQYLDSDDVLLSRKFELQVAGLRAHPECGVAYGRTRLQFPDGSAEDPLKDTGTRIETMFPAFLRSRWWATITPLYRASLCERAGPWSDLSLEEDWEYDCRVAALGVKLVFCEERIAVQRDHEDSRLCRGEPLDPRRLVQRARSHKLIYGHAVRARIGVQTLELRHFARELFLLARQCGAAGLAAESRELFLLAREASGSARGRGMDFRLYRAAATMLGWPLAGKIACLSDRLRKS